MTTQAQIAELEPDEGDLEVGPPPPSLLLRLGSELLGTFVLVLAIVGTAAYISIGANIGPLPMALAGGFTLVALIALLGSTSGAHLNPAVSLGMAIAGRLSWADLVPYVVAQVVGGIGAGLVVRSLVPEGITTLVGAASTQEFLSRFANGYGEHSPLAAITGQAAAQAGIAAPTFSLTQVLVVEGIATAILVGVVLASTRLVPTIAPLAIGLVLSAMLLLTGPISNGALNPARSMSMVFFADGWALSQVWVFWAAPLLGAAIAGLIAASLPSDSVDIDDEDWDDEDDDEVPGPVTTAWEDDDDHEIELDADPADRTDGTDHDDDHDDPAALPREETDRRDG